MFGGHALYVLAGQNEDMEGLPGGSGEDLQGRGLGAKELLEAGRGPGGD